MHIEIHILPDHFPIDPDSWHREMSSLMGRIEQLIMDGTINLRAYAKGKTTLLAEDGSGMIVATIDIRRSRKTMNHETVCCDCRTPFVPLKNDIIVNEVNDEGMSVRLWCADLWNCPSCGHRMIKGWGQNPIAEHYEEGYEASLSKCKATGVMFTVCNQRGRLSEWDGSTN